jgi:hypothetical protein
MNLDLARARWIRPRLLPPAITRLAPEVPIPVLASTCSTSWLREYLLWWIAHADPDGQFAARTGWLRWLPASVQLRALFAFGYDGLVYLKDGAVMGHMFFQRRGGAIHGFSNAISEPFEGHGYSIVMMLDFVAYAAATPGVSRVRVGTGRNKVSRRFLEQIKSRETRLGWRVSPDGWVTFPGSSGPDLGFTPREEVFSNVYSRNLWGDPESVSGPGSNRERAAAFRAELPPLLEAFQVKTLLDAPCGDFNWMRDLQWRVERYVGVDIVPAIIEKNQRAYGNATRTFLHLDLVSDPLPHADAIVCRDCLVHFSLADIHGALLNFKRSGALYVLTTTFPRVDTNNEIQTGDWRPINLQQPPFNFPLPLELINEKRRGPDGTDLGKCLGLWRLDSIALDESGSTPAS